MNDEFNTSEKIVKLANDITKECLKQKVKREDEFLKSVEPLTKQLQKQGFNLGYTYTEVDSQATNEFEKHYFYYNKELNEILSIAQARKLMTK